jgi:hypothetical protein
VKRTSPLALFTAAVLGLGAGFLVDQLLTAGGRATFTPAIGLPILLVLLGLAEILLALPIRRATRATVSSTGATSSALVPGSVRRSATAASIVVPRSPRFDPRATTAVTDASSPTPCASRRFTALPRCARG